MTRKYFGTDGIRGRVGIAPITPDFVLRLGYAAGKVLSRADVAPPHRDRPAVLIGKDTRLSGYMLESALEAGLSTAGVDTLLLGPMPTPAVAFLTRALRLSAGIMISASHNPFEDNGIKFFSAEGVKLPDAVESEIEAALTEPMTPPAPASLGKAERVHDAEGRYLEFCKQTFPKERSLRGVKLVVDCAHGSNYRVGPRVFQELGAEVVAIGDRPNGTNINAGFGATSPQTLAKAVVEHQADFGIAFDGDGDRLAMADHDGRLFDGDQLLYAIVKHRHATGVLRGGVVGTLMTNFALEQRLREMKIGFERAKVGDRYVLELLVEKGWECGGENSGHLLCLDRHSTGDAIISALQVLAALVATGQTLGDLTRDLTLFPQKLVNVKLARAFDVQAPLVREAIAAAEASLAGRGRVLLRPSGTEPVLRVMVEGEDGARVSRLADDIAAAVRAADQAAAA
ncbi:phosphoglucosamine mutase [Usitatibacter palustris]|uniref:Phosphoglucosamine mutase n=1 Tax=Usitatibacter palustris TaxID=2732487 RepID=A0A6M4HDN4_9PROT|nr:phosphoglucosamine mutase [Usitatibacter palustris]QJR16097.1 Phosphoglucosamine mutase [Usitatibacter palustris]